MDWKTARARAAADDLARMQAQARNMGNDGLAAALARQIERMQAEDRE